MSDLKFSINMIMLPKTPEWMILGSFMLLVVYALYSGIEGLFRIAGILLPMVTIVYVLQVILLMSSGILHFHYLLPIAGEGWARIINAVWPTGITQTFGESLLFAMFWPLVADQKQVSKASIMAVISSGLIFTFLNLFTVMALGEGVFMQSIYPTISLLRLITVGDFIENMEVLGLMYFIITTFFKLSFYLFGCVLAMQQLTFVKNERPFIVPITIIAYGIGYTMASDLMEHLQVAFANLDYYIWLPLLIYLPMILLLVTWVRKKWVRKSTI